MTMQLIDEIEAQVAINGESFRGPLLREAWPRIKAALLAGKEMADYMEHSDDDDSQHGNASREHEPNCPLCQAVNRFRAATEGTK
jgi:hypothetical protein